MKKYYELETLKYTVMVQRNVELNADCTLFLFLAFINIWTRYSTVKMLILERPPAATRNSYTISYYNAVTCTMTINYA